MTFKMTLIISINWLHWTMHCFHWDKYVPCKTPRCITKALIKNWPKIVRTITMLTKDFLFFASFRTAWFNKAKAIPANSAMHEDSYFFTINSKRHFNHISLESKLWTAIIKKTSQNGCLILIFLFYLARVRLELLPVLIWGHSGMLNSEISLTLLKATMKV